MNVNPAFISVLVLVAIFAVSILRGVNLGVLGLVAAFGVGIFSVGLSPDEILAGFPVDLLLALVGLTFLFGFAQDNGSLDLVVRWGVRVIGGRVTLAPWGFFLLSAALMSVGAVFAVAIVAPLAMPFARKFHINRTMMGAMVVHGAVAGSLSPVSIYGIFLNGALVSRGVSPNPAALMLAALIFNAIAAVVVYVSMGGLARRTVKIDGRRRPQAERRLAERGREPRRETAQMLATLKGLPAQDYEAAQATTRPNLFQIVTIVGIATMAVAVAAFNADVGAVSLAIAVTLAAIWPKAARSAFSHINWTTALLVAGIITYISVCQSAGVTENMSTSIGMLGAPLLAVLLLCYLEGIVSAMASSIATMGLAFAVAGPLLGGGHVNAIAFAAAIGISATVVDVSPFSTQGALILANVDEDEHSIVYRRLLVYAAIVVAAAPALAWLTIIVPTTS